MWVGARGGRVDDGGKRRARQSVAAGTSKGAIEMEGARKPRTFDVEGILHFTSGVLLRHKHGVKVPKGRFDETVGRHFGETGCQLVFMTGCHSCCLGLRYDSTQIRPSVSYSKVRTCPPGQYSCGLTRCPSRDPASHLHIPIPQPPPPTPPSSSLPHPSNHLTLVRTKEGRVKIYPMSKKICLISSLTFNNGCNAPPSVG